MPDDVRAEKLGKYGAFFMPESTQQCGYIMATMSVIMLIGGAMLETLSFDKLYSQFDFVKDAYGSYSYTAYCGYWCGALILACAVVAIRGASHPSDKTVGAVFLASLVSLAFSLVSIIIVAAEWSKADTINSLCSKCSSGQMLLAAYGVTLSTSSFAAVSAVLLGLLTIQTILAGRRDRSSQGINQTMVNPLQSQL